jgi:hypothetical protein
LVKVALTDQEGNQRWGTEYPQVFTFRSNIRGSFDKVPKDIGGRDTHVIFETDDGQSILIRRTNDKASADLQTFDLLATSKEAGRAGQPLGRTELDTSMLKDIVVVPGEPLVLGIDPSTGKRIRTRGKVTSITSFNMDDKGLVDLSHPWLTKRPEMRRDSIQQFDERLRTVRQTEEAPMLGSVAVKQTEIDTA